MEKKGAFLSSMELIFERISTEETLKEVATEISKELMSHSEFCLWLDAPMGAGEDDFKPFFIEGDGPRRKNSSNLANLYLHQ